jgi:hypothetical protein
MLVHVHIEDSEQQNYIEASARIRGVSVTKLMNKITNRVLRDQLIQSILDDADHLLDDVTIARNRVLSSARFKRRYGNWKD